MAIGDHAISDRAISAPEDVVVVGVTLPGRCAVRDLPTFGAEVFDSPAQPCWVSDAPSNDVALGDASVLHATVSDEQVLSVTIGSFFQ